MKIKRYKVKDAKILSCILLLPMFGIIFLSWDYFETMLNGPVNSFEYKLNVVFRYSTSIFIGLGFYLSLNLLIWNRLKSRKDKYKVIRFLYHYNKCVEAFHNMDIQKVRYIYETRLKGVEVDNVLLEPLKDRIKFGYNVMSCNSNKEKLKPLKKYEE